MTLLAIDCGNSRLKWGFCQTAPEHNVHWLAQGALPYADLAGFADILRAQPLAERAVVANVAGALVADVISATLSALQLPAHWARGQAEQCGVRNHYEQPEQLGADRWAALIGARHLHRGPCLVVSAGTASTVDVLDADGNFQGGLILPGADLMLRALAQNTAQLPLSDGHFTGLPRNTADAITSGCLHAQLGAIERMYAQVAALPDAICLVTGGGASQFFDLLRIPKRWVDNLVLEGLVRIGD